MFYKLFYYIRYTQLEKLISSTDSYMHCTGSFQDELSVYKIPPNSNCENIDKYKGKIIKRTKIVIDENGFRKTQDDFDHKKGRVVVFGCSFAFGYRLEDNQTFAWRLSEITKRKVYNVSYSGEGIQHMLYSLQSENFWQKIPDSDYFIYILINDHFRRLISPTNLGDGNFYPTYSLMSDGSLKLNKPSEYFIKATSEERINLKKKSYITYTGFDFKDAKLQKLSVAVLKESERLIKQKRPTAKFIIMYIDGDSDVVNLLRNNGFDVFSCNETFGNNQYMQEYMVLNGHPNAEFWKVLTPKFVGQERL